MKQCRMKPERIIEIGALAVFLLFLQEWRIAGITVRTLFVYLYMVITGIGWLKNPQKRKWTSLDSLLGCFLVWNLLQFAAGLITGKGCEENNLLLIALLLLFFIESVKEETVDLRENFLKNGILLCAVPVFLGLFWHYFMDSRFDFNLRPLLGNEEAMASYLLLICILATVEYCRESEPIKRRFCTVLSLTGYFLLFMSRNIMGIVILGLFFPVFLFLQKPARRFFRDLSKMAFLYIFLLANMPLAENFILAEGTGKFYSLESGVYLELLLATATVFFLSWWDKLPEGNDRPLYDFRRLVGKLLVCVAVFLFLILAMGKRLEGMDAGLGMDALKRLASGMRTYCEQHNGLFLDVLQKYGVIGMVWLFGVMLAAAKRIGMQMRRERLTSVGMLVCILFFAQSLFFSFQPVTAPVSVLFLAECLYGRTKARGGSGRQENDDWEIRNLALELCGASEEYDMPEECGAATLAYREDSREEVDVYEGE